MIFGWRKGESGNAAKPFEAQPDKARKFFEHARTVGEADQLEYALQLYANGLKLDPANVEAHEGMYQVACKHHVGTGGAATGKDIKEIDGPSAIDKMVVAEYTWMRDLNNASAALRFLEAAGKAAQVEVGQWLAPKMLNILRGVMKAKPQKKVWLKAMELFSEVQAWDEAFSCGEEAQRLDPSDTNLEHEMRQLTAARAIKQGGYEKTYGQEGGFRGQVRDAQVVRVQLEAVLGQLEEAGHVHGDRLLLVVALAALAQELRVAVDGLGGLRVLLPVLLGLVDGCLGAAAGAGDAVCGVELALPLGIAQLRRASRTATEQLEQAPDNPALQAAADKARMELLELEGTVYRERVGKYPTNREMKADLGRVEYELGRYEDAMAAFQAAKDDPKLRVNSAWMLGKCFAKEGWHSEAVSEFKEALAALDATQSERELEIKYDLMLSLIELAKLEKSGAHAKEAAELCSAIVRKNIAFRDVRARRKEVDELVRTLG
ncbi:MAG: hypothetical protein ACKOTD_02305 [Phycisphaerales bacterium]